MIDELIEDYIKSQLEPLEKEIQEIKQKIEELKQKKDKCELDYKKNDEEQALALINNAGIKGFFNRIFRRKVYNQRKYLSDKLEKKREELLETKYTIRDEISALEKDLREKLEAHNNLKNNVEEQKLHENKRIAIKLLIEKDPKLAESVEFMKEAISIDITSIRFDKTDNPELYKEYAYKLREFYINEFAKSKNIDSKEGAKEIEENPMYCILKYSYEKLGRIINELENPKVPEEGKYKIPHKYLYEAFRDFVERFIRDGNTDLSRLVGHDNGQIDTLSSYLNMDCNIPIEDGQKLEKFFETCRNEKYDILQHKFVLAHSDGKLKMDTVYSHGKKESSFNENEKHNADATFTGTFNKSATFIDLLDRSPKQYKIIAIVPKKAFEKESSIPVWGSDSINGDAYLLPDYIFGIMNPNGEIKPNPIPKEERKKYNFLFANGSLKPIEETRAIEEQGER